MVSEDANLGHQRLVAYIGSLWYNLKMKQPNPADVLLGSPEHQPTILSPRHHGQPEKRAAATLEKGEHIYPKPYLWSRQRRSTTAHMVPTKGAATKEITTSTAWIWPARSKLELPA
jgi:hypothetical protein